MKPFVRSRSFPVVSAQKGGFGAKFLHRTHQEDEECLLQRDDEREQETLHDYRRELSNHGDDYERKATVFESLCKSLEKRLVEVKRRYTTMEQIHQEAEKRREKQEKETNSTINQMRAYISKLENDYFFITGSLAKRDGNHYEGTSKDSLEQGVTPPDQPQVAKRKKLASKKYGPSWDLVSILAQKLSQVQKENHALRDSMVAKREAMEDVIATTTSLRTQLEEARYENERLTIKCQSLEDASSALVKEVEGSESTIVVDNQRLFLEAQVRKLEERNQFLLQELNSIKNVDKNERHEDDVRGIMSALDDIDEVRNTGGFLETKLVTSAGGIPEEVAEDAETTTNSQAKSSNGSSEHLPEAGAPAASVASESKANDEGSACGTHDSFDRVFDNIDLFSTGSTSESISSSYSDHLADKVKSCSFVVEMDSKDSNEEETAQEYVTDPKPSQWSTEDEDSSVTNESEARDGLGPLPTNPFSFVERQKGGPAISSLEISQTEDTKSFLQLVGVESMGIDGPGTYLHGELQAKRNSDDDISSDGGEESHARFEIPLNVQRKNSAVWC